MLLIWILMLGLRGNFVSLYIIFERAIGVTDRRRSCEKRAPCRCGKSEPDYKWADFDGAGWEKAAAAPERCFL